MDALRAKCGQNCPFLSLPRFQIATRKHRTSSCANSTYNLQCCPENWVRFLTYFARGADAPTARKMQQTLHLPKSASQMTLVLRWRIAFLRSAGSIGVSEGCVGAMACSNEEPTRTSALPDGTIDLPCSNRSSKISPTSATRTRAACAMPRRGVGRCVMIAMRS